MNRNLRNIVLVAGLLVLGIAIWETQFRMNEKLLTFERTPEGIMGTSCRLSVVTDYRDRDKAKKILDKAEYRIRYIESVASNWIDESEISLFNTEKIETPFEFTHDNWAVLRYGAQAFKETNGAFDITCRPLIELWKAAGRKGVLPTEAEIQTARDESSWDQLEFGENQTLAKKAPGVRVDLGGIAKGYAIDQAVQAMIDLGAKGGLVDIGGDLRCFGKSSRGDGCWTVDIKNPFRDGSLASLDVCNGESVCTSGDYARYVEIEGKHYSHIINPVTGYPTEEVPSVTVIAGEAMVADVWATALSVMGPDGMQFLPDGVEALMIYNDHGSPEVFRSESFPVEVSDLAINSDSEN